MAKLKHASTALTVYVAMTTAVIFKPQNEFKVLSAENTSFTVHLQPWSNNRAFGVETEDLGL